MIKPSLRCKLCPCMMVFLPEVQWARNFETKLVGSGSRLQQSG